MMCTYCGVETPTIDNVGMCSNCESVVYVDAETLQTKDAQLFTELAAVNDRLSSFDYDGALAAYDSIIAAKKDPAYLYAKALVYIKYSNYSMSSIRYDRRGFMEENIPLKDKAISLAADARQLLTLALNAAMADMGSDKPPLGIAYTAFLSAVKLSDLKAAGYAMEKINVSDSAYVGAYAAMVLGAELRKPDEALKHAGQLTGRARFSINAFFYIAQALYDKGRFAEAKRLAEELKPVMKGSGSVDALISDAGKQLLI